MNSRILTLIAILSVAGISANAQAPDHERVKVISTDDAGVVKLIYAIQVDKPVTVAFLTREGQLIMEDKIKGNYPKGFLRRYNVRDLGNDFRIEVSSQEMTVTYRLSPTKDQKYVAQLEKTVYNNDLIAKKN